MPHADCTAEQNAVNSLSQQVVAKNAEIGLIQAELQVAQGELTVLLAQLAQANAALAACQGQGHSGGG